jgi:hypothetical protein
VKWDYFIHVRTGFAQIQDHLVNDGRYLRGRERSPKLSQERRVEHEVSDHIQPNQQDLSD